MNLVLQTNSDYYNFFRHCQWKKVISRYQQTKDSENGVSSELHYKDMCQRFVKIFGLKDNRKTETHAPSVLHGMDYVCCKCKGMIYNYKFIIILIYMCLLLILAEVCHG